MIRLVTLDLRGVQVGLWQILRSISQATITKLFGTSLLVLLTIILGLGALVIPGIALIIYFLFAPAVVVEENIGYRAAMKRSYQLVKGNWWYILGSFLLASIAAQLLVQIIARLLGFFLLYLGLDEDIGILARSEQEIDNGGACYSGNRSHYLFLVRSGGGRRGKYRISGRNETELSAG